MQSIRNSGADRSERRAASTPRRHGLFSSTALIPAIAALAGGVMMLTPGQAHAQALVDPGTTANGFGNNGLCLDAAQDLCPIDLGAINETPPPVVTSIATGPLARSFLIGGDNGAQIFSINANGDFEYFSDFNQNSLVLNKPITNFIVTGNSSQLGAITESGGARTLRKTGSARLDIGCLGGCVTNTYSGGTIIAEGFLGWDRDNAFGAAGTSITIDGGAGLLFNGTFSTNRPITLSGGTATISAFRSDPINRTGTISGVISGPGGLRIGGNAQQFGTVVLSGANSYQGGTTIASGTLSVSSDGNLGASGTGVSIGNATFDFGGSFSTSRPFDLTGQAKISVGTGLTGTITSALSGNSGSLDKLGAGTLVLSGTNSYRFGTTIAGGTLQIEADANLGAAGLFVSISDGAGLTFANNSFATARTITLSGTGGTITVNPALTTTLNGVIQGGAGLTKSGGGTLILANDNSYQGTTTINAGILQIGNGGTAGTLGLGDVTNNATLTFNRSNDLTVSNAISGGGSVIKNGAGTVTLTGGKSYTGSTTINAGTLALRGTLGFTGGGVLTLSGGTLDMGVDGNFSSATHNSGTLALGGRTLSVTTGNYGLTNGAITGGGVISLLGTSRNFNISSATASIAPDVTIRSVGTNSSVSISLTGDFTLGANLDGSAVSNAPGSLSLIIDNLGFTTTISGNNNHRLGTVVNLGTLALGSDTALGTGSLFLNPNTALTSVGLRSVANPVVLVAGNATIRNADTSNTFTLGGVVSGGTGFTKTGAGTLILSGANTYSGTTTILAGTLQIGNGGTSGALGSGQVNNSGTLVFNRSDDATFSNIISGTGTLRKLGAGIATLSSAITQGSIVIEAGTLALNAANTIGGITVTGGTLRLGATGAAGGASGQITTTGSVIDYADGITNATPILLNSNTTQLQVSTGSATQSGAISETGGSRPLEKIGAGTLTLSGANTYSGGTTITGGVLAIGSDAALGAASGGLTIGAATLQLNGTQSSARAINLAGNSTIASTTGSNWNLSGAITGSGSLTKNGSGTLVLSGANAYDATTISLGTLQIGAGGTTGSLGLSEVSNNASLVFNRSNNLTVTNRITGTGSVTKLGAGTLILSGLNTYAGGTTITAGTLQLGSVGGSPGMVGSGPVSIASGASLRFDGGGNKVVSGAISGDGSITVAGTGNAVLNNANNTFTGGTTVNSGTLALAGASSAGTGAITLNGGTLQANASFTLTNALTIPNGADARITTAPGVTLTKTGLIANPLNFIGTLRIATTGTGVNAGTFQFSSAATTAATARLIIESGTLLNTTTVVLPAILNVIDLTQIDSAGTLNLGGIAFGGTDGIKNLRGSGTLINNGATTRILSGIFSGNISGTQNIVSTGTLTLSGASSFTGDATVSSGTLTVTNSQGLGTAAGATTIADGATVALSSDLTLIGENFTISGSGVGGNGALRSLAGFTATTGTVTLAADALITSDSAGLNLGNVAGGGNVLRLGGFGRIAINGAISNLSELITGSPVTLFGTNTFTGRTTVNGGILDLTGGSSLSDTAQLFVNGAFARFSSSETIGSLAGSGTVQIATGSPAPPNITLTTGGDNTSSTFTGRLQGAGSLIKTGTGTFTLTDTALYSGTTTINGGVLQLGNGGTSGGLGTGAVTNNAALVFNRSNNITANNAISGTGTLTKLGAGVLTLSGASSYAGLTTVSAGTLTVANATALGSSTGGTVVNDGTTLELQGDITVTGEALTINGTGVSGGGALRNVSGTNGWTGAITLGSDSTIIAADGRLNISTIDIGARNLTTGGAGVIAISSATGTGSLTVSGGSTGLFGTSNFAGGVTVNSGALFAQSGTAINDLATVIINGGGVIVGVSETIGSLAATGGTVQLSAGQTLTMGGNGTSTSFAGLTFSDGNLAKQGAGTFTVTGTLAHLGTTTISGGTLQFGNGGTVGFIDRGSIINNAALVFNRSDNITIGVPISGTGTLTKLGAGVLTLGGTSSYSGTTTVSAGTLALNHATAGAIDAAGTGAILLGNGTVLQANVGGTLTNNIEIAMGNSVTIGATAGTAVQLQPGRLSALGGLGTTLTFGSDTLVGDVTLATGLFTTAGGGRLAVAGGTLKLGSNTADDVVTGLNGGTRVGTTGTSATLDLNGFSTTVINLVGTAAGTITNTSVTPGLLTLANSNSTQYDGLISGAALRIAKTATGTLTLTGNNTYGGTSTISAGVLQIGSGGTSGSLGSGDVINNAQLVFNRSNDFTVANAISGSGTLSKLGAGRLTLSGASSYAGQTTVSAGTLTVANATALGTNGGGTVANDGTTLELQGGITVTGEALTINGIGVSGGGALRNVSGNNRWTGTIFLGSDASIFAADGRLDIDAIDNGTRNLTTGGAGVIAITSATGTGSLTVSGGSTGLFGTSNFAGGVTVNSGALFAQSGTAINDLAAVIINGGGVIVGVSETIGSLAATGGTVQLSAGQTLTMGGNGTSTSFAGLTFSDGNLAKQGAGTFTVTGTLAHLGTTTISGGTLQFGNGGTVGFIDRGSIINNAALVFNRSDDITIGVPISGTGTLTKLGAGVLTLTGANAVNGGITVTAGTLQIGNGGTSGALGTGAITNNGILAINLSSDITLAQLITGTGALRKRGTGVATVSSNLVLGSATVEAGTLLLSGSNSFTNGIVVAGGTLALRSVNAAGGATGIIRTTGSVIDYSDGLVMATPIQLGSNTTQLQVLAGAATQSGVISETGGARPLEKIGAGTLTLSGTNTYSGGTVITAGRLNVASDANLGAIAGGLTIGNGVLGSTATFSSARNVVLTGAAGIDVLTGTSLTLNGALSGTGSLAKTGNGQLVLTANNSYAGPTTISGTGGLTVGIGGTTGALGTGNITVNGSSFLAFNRSDAFTVANVISGLGNVGKQGGGVMTLTGANSFSGGLGIAAGTVALGHATGGVIDAAGSGTIQLLANSTLRSDVSGTLNNTLTLNAANVTVAAATGTTLRLASSQIFFDGPAGSPLNFGAPTLFGTIELAPVALSLGAAVNPIAINGGTLRLSNANAVTLLNGSNGITLNGATLGADVVGTLTKPLMVTAAGGTIDVASTSLEFSGANTFNGALIKTGTGDLRFSGATTGSSTVQLNTGMISLLTDTSSFGTGTLQMATGTTLRLPTAAGRTLANDIVLGADAGSGIIAPSLILSGALSGGRLNVVGGGPLAGSTTLILTGNNTYGATSIAAGNILQVGRLGTGGTLGTGNVTVGAGSTLRFSGNNLTVANTISGDGKLVRDGLGTTTLSGANSYAGGTRITGGGIEIGNAGALGTGALTMSGDSVLTTAAGISATVAGLTIGNFANANISAASGQTLSLGGPLDFSNFATSLVFGTTTKTGTVGIAFAPAPGPVSTASIRIHGGTLRLGAASDVFLLRAGGGLTVGTSATLDLNGFAGGGVNLSGAGVITNSSATAAQFTALQNASSTFGGVIGGGTGTISLLKSGAGTLTLTGANTYSGTTSITGGSLQIGDGGTTGSIGTGTVSISSGAQLLLNRSDAVSMANLLTGAGTVQKNLANALTLTGANTAADAFTGTFNVNGGTLLVNATLGDVTNRTATVNVASGAALGGSGTIQGNVVVANGGILSPGNSPATQTIAGNLTLNDSSVLNFELAQAGVVGGGINDLISVGGNLVLDGTLNVTALTGFGAGLYRLFNYGGTLTNSQLTLGTLPLGFTSSVLTDIAGQVNILFNAGTQTIQFWDGGDTTGALATTNGDGGAGSWTSTSTNWTAPTGFAVNSAWAGQAGVFAGAAGGIVSVTGTQAFQELRFLTDGYTLNPIGPTGGLATTGGFSIINVDTGISARLNTPVSGAAGLTKTGAGTLTLAGANSYSGTTTVTGGTLSLLSSGVIAGAVQNNATLANGGTINGLVTNAGTLTSTGTLAGGLTNSAGAMASLSGSIGGAINNFGTISLTASVNSTAALVLDSTGILNIGSTFSAFGSLAGSGRINGGSGGSLTVGGDNSSTAFSGSMIGGGSLVKLGTGTLTLTNATVETSTLDINQGSAIITNGFGSAFGPTTVSNRANLTFGGTYAGTIANTGNLVFNGTAGSLNNLQGGTARVSGAVTLNFNNSSNAILTGNTTVGSRATLNGNSTTDIGAFDFTVGSIDGLLGTITLNGGRFTIGGAPQTSTLGAVISGNGELRKIGNSALTLTSGNTFTGPTTVSEGTLSLTTTGSLAGTVLNNASLVNAGSITGLVANNATLASSGRLFGGLTNAAGATATVSGTLNGPVTNSGAITLNGATSGSANLSQNASGTFNLAGFNATIRSLEGNGTIQLGAGTLSLAGNGISTSFGGAISGSGNFTKLGTGTLTLSGLNSFTGLTTINLGSIVLATGASLASSVQNNATFINAGTATGVFTNAATLVSTGTLAGGLVNNVGATASLANSVSGAITNSGVITLTAALSGSPSFTQNSGASLDLAGFNATLGSVAGNGTIQLGAGTLTAGASNASTSFDGIISGSGTLAKTGTGTLTLGGVNTLTGLTTVGQGTLSIGTTGSLAGGVQNSASLVNAGTIAGLVTNAGSLVSTGTLNGGLANNAAATASVRGTINGPVTNASALTLTGGTTGNAAVTQTSTGTFNLAGFDATIGSLAGLGSVQLGSGTLTLGGANVDTDFAGVISGNGGLIKTGTATQTLSGANTFAGATTINQGTILVSATGSLAGAVQNNAGFSNSGTVSGLVTNAGTLVSGGRLEGGLVNAAGATASLANIVDGAVSNSGTITLTARLTANAALTQASGGTINLAGFNATIGSISGTGAVQLGGGTLTTGGSNASTTFDGIISGTGGLAKTGTGTLTLGGSNTAAANFTGTLSVNAGTLLINGQMGDVAGNAATLSVANGATLGGSGNFLGSIALGSGSILAPGNSPGTLAIGGNLALDAGSILNFELAQAGVVGGGINDLITVGGNLTLAGTLNVTTLPGFGEGIYRLFNYGGTLTDNGLLFGQRPAGFTTSLVTNVAGEISARFTLGVPTVLYWDGGDLTGSSNATNGNGGSGIWNSNNGNWTSAPAFSANFAWGSQTGVFAGAAGGTVQVSGTQAFQELRFETSGYNLNPADGTGRLATTGGFSIIDVSSAAGSAGLNLGISGTGGLTKTGAGTLILANSNTYSGSTTVSAGTLRLSTVGTLAGAVQNNASFVNEGIIAGAVTNSGTLNSTGSLNGGLTNTAGATASLAGRVNGTVTNAGAITLTGTTTGIGALTQASTGTLNLNGFASTIGSLAGAGAIQLGGSVMTVGGNNTSTTFSGTTSGIGSLVKTGTSALTLSGMVGHNGLTTVSAGSLALASSGTMSGGVVNNALFSNAGFITGLVTNNTLLTSTGSLSGGLTNAGTGIANLSGQLNGAVSNSGTIQLTGAVTGSSAVTQTAGTFNLNGFTAVIGSLSGSGAVQLGAATLNTGSNSSNTSFAGVISGSGGLTKTGSGTFTLSGVNSYTGLTTISGGTLTLANGGVIAGALQNNTLFTNNGTVQGLVTNSGILRSTGTLAGGLTNNVAQTAELLGTVTGAVSNAGTIRLLGSLTGNGTLNQLSNATFNLGGFNATIGALSGAGSVQLGSGTLTLGGNNATTSFAGVISGSGGIEKRGTGGFTLTGANSLTGRTLISAGSLTLAAGGSLAGTVLNTATFNSSGTLSGLLTNEAGATANLAGALNNVAINRGTINLTGTTTGITDLTMATGSVFNLGGFATTVGTLAGGGGTVALGSATLTLGSGTQSQTFDGTITGTGGLTKIGANTFSLSGVQSYTGLTSVNGGTFILGSNGALAGALVNNATVSSNGLIAGLVTNSATLISTGALNGGLINAGGGNASIRGTLAGAVSNAGTITLTGATTGIGALTQASTGSFVLGANSTSIGSLAGSGAVRLANGAILSTGGNNASTSFAGTISGNGGLNKAGTGTFTLSAANDFTGLATVTAGTLAIGSGGSLVGGVANNASFTNAGSVGGAVTNTGSLVSTGTLLGALTNAAGATAQLAGQLNNAIANAGTVTLTGAITGIRTVTQDATGIFDLGGFNTSIGSLAGSGSVVLGSATLTTGGDNGSTSLAGAISGNGGLTKTGTGAFVLTGANSYAGLTTVSQGVLSIRNNAGLGSNAAGTAVDAGAALELQGGVTITGEALIINGTGVAGAGALRNVADSNIWAGTVNLGSDSLITADAGRLDIALLAGSTQALTIGGAGLVGIANANTAGALTVTGGSTALFGTGNFASGVNVSAGNLFLQGGSSIDDAAAVTLGTGNLIVAVSETIGSLAGAGGTVQIDAGQTLTLGGNNGSTDFAGVIFNTGNLAKQGSGVFTVTGLLSHSGTTSITGGTLASGAANIWSGNGLVTIGSGGTLSLGGFEQSIAAISLAGGTLANGSLTGSISSIGGTIRDISGTANALQATAGTTTLSGSGSFAQGVTLAGGDVVLQGAGASIADTALVAVNAGTLFVNVGETIGALAGSGGRVQIAAGQVLNTGSSNASSSYAGVLSGDGSLLKAGTGTFTLSGANTLTGTATVNAGALALASGGSLSGAVLNNAGFSNAGTVAGLVTNTGTLISNGVLGGGLVNSGSAGLSSQLNGGVTNSGLVQLQGGLTGITGFSQTANGSFDLAGFNTSIGSLSGAGTLLLGNATLTLGGSNVSTSFGGTIGGTGGLIKTGSGAFTLTSGQGYTGLTTVSAGLLSLTASAGLSGSVLNNAGFASSGLILGSLTNNGTATLAGQINGAVANNAAITLSGQLIVQGRLTQNAGGSTNLAGFNASLGSLAGLGPIQLGSGTLVVGSDNSSSLFSGVISGSGGLQKLGTGTFTLTGINSYTGLTVVNAGTLVIGEGASIGGTTSSIAAMIAAPAPESAPVATVANAAPSPIVAEQASMPAAVVSLAAAPAPTATAPTAPATTATASVGTRADMLADNGWIAGGRTPASLTSGAQRLPLAGGVSSGPERVDLFADPVAGTVSADLPVVTIGEAPQSVAVAPVTTAPATRVAMVSDISNGMGTARLEGAVLGGAEPASPVASALIDPLAPAASAGEAAMAGTLSNAVIAGSVLNNANLINNGSILGQLVNSAGATAVNNGVIRGLVTNNGTFTSVGTLSGGLANSGTARLSGVLTGDVLNSGSITLTGITTGIAVFQQAASGSLNLGGFDTTLGVLSGAGTIALGNARLTTGTNGVNSLFSGVISGTGALTKTGTGGLILAGDNVYGGGTTIAAGTLQLGNGGTTGSIIGPVINNGTLIINRSNAYSLTGPISGTGMFVQAGTGTTTLIGPNSYTGGTLVSAGRLIGSTVSLQGVIQNDAALEFAQATNGVFIGRIGGTGLLDKTGTGLLELTADSSGLRGATTVRGGELRITGSLAGSATTILSGATLSGTGTVGGLTARSGSVVSPGVNGLGMLGVNGAIQLQSGSTLRLQIQAPAGSDMLIGNGALQLGGTAALTNLGGTYAFNSNYLLLQATGGRTGTFDTVTGFGEFGILYRPELVYTANQVLLRMAPNLLANIVGGTPLTANQRSVVSRIDAAVTAGYNPQPLFNVYALPNAQQPGAFDQLSGEVYATAAGVGIEQERLVREAVLGRIGAVAATSRQTPEWGNGAGAWGQVFGSWGNGNRDGNAARYESDRQGFITGIDFGNANSEGSWRIGAFGMHMTSKVSVDARGSRTEVEQTGGGLYAGVNSGGVSVGMGASVTGVDLTSVRNIALPGLAETNRGRGDGRAVQGFAELSYAIDAGNATYRPFASVAAGSFRLDALTETGGAAALAVRRQSYSSGSITVGADGVVRMGKVQLSGTLAGRVQIGDRDPAAQIALAAAPAQAFTIRGVQLDSFALATRLDATVKLGRNADLSIGYTGLIGKDTADHGARATLSVRF